MTYLVALPICLVANAFAIREEKRCWKKALTEYRDPRNSYDREYISSKVQGHAQEILHLRKWRWIILFWPLYGLYKAGLYIAIVLLTVVAYVVNFKFNFKDRAVENEMIRRHATEKL